MTRQKIDFHINTSPNDYPTHKNHFKFLGLLTCKKEDTLKLRPKPLSLKSKSKGSIDVVCRNVLEFQTFLAEGKLQRHHFASIQTQLFDSSFCLNGIYLNVAKLLNREILVAYEGSGSMPWLHKIDPRFYHKITKLVQFYFKSQYLHINRYLLCKELSLNKMHNMVIGFSDGSQHFASSVVYLVSYNPNSF